MEEKILNVILTEIKDMKKEMNERFEQISTDMNQRFEQIDERFEQIDERFEQIDERFEQIDERFEQMAKDFNEKIDQVNQRIDQLTHDVAEEIREFSILVSKKENENFQILNNQIKGTDTQFKDFKGKMKKVSQELQKAVS